MVETSISAGQPQYREWHMKLAHSHPKELRIWNHGGESGRGKREEGER